jgi:tRNA U38,U39,U40 pseudouridine synthase TruA
MGNLMVLSSEGKVHLRNQGKSQFMQKIVRKIILVYVCVSRRRMNTESILKVDP